MPITLTFNPKDYTELYYGSDGGVIYKYELAQPESIIVSEIHCGSFVGVAYGGAGKFCLVSLIVTLYNYYMFAFHFIVAKCFASSY